MDTKGSIPFFCAPGCFWCRQSSELFPRALPRETPLQADRRLGDRDVGWETIWHFGYLLLDPDDCVEALRALGGYE